MTKVSIRYSHVRVDATRLFNHARFIHIDIDSASIHRDFLRSTTSPRSLQVSEFQSFGVSEKDGRKDLCAMRLH